MDYRCGSSKSSASCLTYFLTGPVDSRITNSGAMVISAGNSCVAIADALQQDLRAAFAHLEQRLPHRGQRRRGIGGRQNIVESHHRHVPGNREARILQCANGADGRDVVEAEDGREVAAASRAAPAWACSRSPAPWGDGPSSSTSPPHRCESRIAGSILQADLPRHLLDALPAKFRVGNRLAGRA